MAKTPKALPVSAHSIKASLAGVAVFSFARTFFWPVQEPPIVQMLLAMLLYIIPVIFCNFVILKSHKKNDEINWNKKAPINWDRTFSKILGLTVVFFCIGFFYWLMPIYQEEFYESYFVLLKFVFPFLCIAAVPYIAITDRKMKDPKDTYFHLGQRLRGKDNGLNTNMLKQLSLGWLVKAFFLPLMITFFSLHLNAVTKNDFFQNFEFKELYDLLMNYAYMIDVLIGTIGYIFTFKILNTHIRSTEYTVGGWAVALLCYPPFLGVTTKDYFAYKSFEWIDWLSGMPVLMIIWGLITLALSFIYIYATICFGLSFSNLTYRGLISSGCYKWSKHPAYLTKNLSWWFMAAPFLVDGGIVEITRNCLLLLGINSIYYFRAKTEERHLMQYPEYKDYYEWMNQNGVITKRLYKLEKAFGKFIFKNKP